MFRTGIIAVLITAASGALAADVYSTFYGNIGAFSPNFDIANDGCFSVSGGAVKVSFSSEAQSHYDGPYCLSAWSEGGCSGDSDAEQQFGDLHNGDQHSLDNGVEKAGSFKWAAHAC
ncbi:hypothetical protein Q7P37_000271 [Cladosporium fusiforme]